MKLKNSERLRRIKKIENTDYLANMEIRDAIKYIKVAYDFKNIAQAQEFYKNWRKEYLKDIRRH